MNAADNVVKRAKATGVLVAFSLIGVLYWSYREFGQNRMILVGLVCLFVATLLRYNVLILLHGSRDLDFNNDPFGKRENRDR